MLRAFSFFWVALILGCSGKSEPKIYEMADIQLETPDGEFVWAIDTENTKVGFEALEKGTAFKGHFERFNISISLDPEKPELGEIRALIDLNSVKAGNADRDDALKTPELFYIEKFPVAEFRTTNIFQTGPENYEAVGNLSMKGVSNEIVLPFTLTQKDDEATAQAEYRFNRLDYKIGTGSFSDEKYIGYPVTVRIEVNATR